MQAGRRRLMLRPFAAYAPRVLGLLLVGLLVLSAVPNVLACCRPGHPPRPPGSAGRAAAPFAASTAVPETERPSAPGASAFESAAFSTSTAPAVSATAENRDSVTLAPAGAQAGQPRCSDDPLDAQAPRIEAPDSWPAHSAANADRLPVSGLPVGAPAGRVSSPPADARGGAGPPLWLRTCVSRT